MLELLGESSLLLLIEGDGGTIVTLGNVLSESPPDSSPPSTLVVMKVGILGFSGVGVVSGFGEGTLCGSGGTGGATVVEGALLRGFEVLDRGDSTERSERSRVWVGDVALTSLDRKLGAIDVR